MRAIKARVIALVLAVAGLITLFGCGSILDDETWSVSPHLEPSASPAGGMTEAGTYDEIEDCILDLILARDDKEKIFRVNINYDGNVQSDIDRACNEIPKYNPIGAYAVSEMVGTVKQIISYYEVELSIAYKDVTKEQLQSIITVTNESDLNYKLLVLLGQYARSFTVLAYGVSLTEEEAREHVTRLYYDNPRDIVIMPVTTVDFYPKFGTDRIIAYTFGYQNETSTLEAMGQYLKDAVRDITDSVLGADAQNVLLLLAQRVMEMTKYDEETAAGEYSNQNQSATAYGALINGSAVSEGYAMAYKALCDQLGIDCTVVFGKYKGAVHAWNIVGLDGYYYHVDVSNCDLYGLDTAFLKNDDDMKDDYVWDTDAYEACDGPITYSGDEASTPAAVTTSSATVTHEAKPEPSDEASADNTTTNETPTASETPAASETTAPAD